MTFPFDALTKVNEGIIIMAINTTVIIVLPLIMPNFNNKGIQTEINKIDINIPVYKMVL